MTRDFELKTIVFELIFQRREIKLLQISLFELELS